MANQAGAKNRFFGAGALPAGDAFHVETIVDPFTLKDVVGMVRHAERPAVFEFTEMPDEAGFQRMGCAYLASLRPLLPVPDEAWIDAKIQSALSQPRPPNRGCFGWLPITPPPSTGGRRQPLGSFWANRGNGDDPPVRPRLLVLMAGSVDTQHQLQFGSDMGLRMVLHVHDDHVRIHGVTLAGLTTPRALDAIPEGDIFELVERVREVVGKALDCGKRVWINSLEKAFQSGAPLKHLIAIGYALRWPKASEPGEGSAVARARTYDFRVEVAVDGRDVQLVRVHRDVYIGAGAAATLSCFVQDGASNDRPPSPDPEDPDNLPESMAQRRPTLRDEDLGKFRDRVSAELAGSRALKFSDGGVEIFETRAASDRSARRLGGRTVGSDGSVVTAARKVPPVRSDEQANVDAHLRAAEFFGRMQAYGLKPETYFRFACLPLVHRTRPAMRWAPDGELPMAEVRPFVDDPTVFQDSWKKPGNALKLLVNYGSADPLHRRKLPLVDSDKYGPARLKAQYLSVASDPRWAWHEFGHVLSFASTGELEFPFAHSAGDALAAIASDPISRLATAEDPEADIRHATYPWIEVPGRSHGRSALRGYGWCGCRNLPRLDFSASLERYRHNYFGEQIMSSSLFRLYRSLGGDTRGAVDQRNDKDEQIRLSASDYCIYLIMRGISLLGPDTLAPARTPDQFVSALIEADLGTGNWDIAEATWPFNRDPRAVSRCGGRVHKVIRWAFEQQGLYATDKPRETAEGPGQPPRVDVYIADRRPAGGTPGDGGYAPVPLRDGKLERWHAHHEWVWRQGERLNVRVANRGRQVAQGVRLWAWWLSAGSQSGTMQWELVAADVEAPDLGSEQPIDIQLELPADAQAKAELWVLVSADAMADTSNLGPGMPLPASWPELGELVAHDNNLALARL